MTTRVGDQNQFSASVDQSPTIYALRTFTDGPGTAKHYPLMHDDRMALDIWQIYDVNRRS
jgi:hypothetical protein